MKTMRLTGYCTIRLDEVVEVEDDFDDLAREQVFNETVEDYWNHGDLADYEYNYELLSDYQDEEEEEEEE